MATPRRERPQALEPSLIVNTRCRERVLCEHGWSRAILTRPSVDREVRFDEVSDIYVYMDLHRSPIHMPRPGTTNGYRLIENNR